MSYLCLALIIIAILILDCKAVAMIRKAGTLRLLESQWASMLFLRISVCCFHFWNMPGGLFCHLKA